jgi:ABC-type uncharacterized transport system substrate-binding protein
VGLRWCLALIAMGLSFAPLVANGQRTAEAPVVGFIATAAIPPNDPLVAAFRKGLVEQGYIEGESIKLEFRSAQGQVDRLPLLLQEMVQLQAKAIVVGTEPAARAAMQVTKSIPIVSISFDYDPVISGLVKSYNHPDANITGIYTRQPELIGKRLELLKEAVPGLARVAVFWDSFGQRQLDDVKRAAQLLHIEIELVELRPPYDFKGAFKAAKDKRAGAVLLVYSGAFYAQRSRIAEEAVESRMPIMSWLDQLTLAGGLMSYGPDARESYRRAAYFIGPLLRGSQPADLPLEQSSQFRLAVNLRTAKALHLSIPQSIMVRADDVIQ